MAGLQTVSQLWSFSRARPLMRKNIGCGIFFPFNCTIPLKQKLYHLYGLRAAVWLCVAAVVMKPDVKDQQREVDGWAHFTVYMFTSFSLKKK